MLLLKNPETNQIVELNAQSKSQLGEFFENWQTPSGSEVTAYELAQAKLQKIADCNNYLQSTNWQIIRLVDPSSEASLETGVLENRTLAWTLPAEIEACTTMEQLNLINTDFS